MEYKSVLYTGKERHPKVTVSINTPNGIKILQENIHYTLSYKNCINAGTAIVCVEGKREFIGEKSVEFKISKATNNVILSSGNKTLTSSATRNITTIISAKSNFGKVSYKSDKAKVKVNSSGKVTVTKGFTGRAKIAITSGGTGNYSSKTKYIYIDVNPAKTVLSSVTPGTKSLTVKWKKNSTASGYVVYASTSKTFKSSKAKVLRSNSTVSAKFTGLKAGKIYYVKVKALTKNGKISYSNVKSCRVKE